MTISLTGSSGFFTRIGAIGGLLYDTNSFQATSIPTDTNNISQYFVGDDLAMIDGFEAQQSSAQSGMGGYPSYWRGVAATILNQMVLNDNPLLSATNTVASLQELIYQMQLHGQTLKQYLTTFSITSTLIQGDGVCVGTVKTPDGLNCQMALNENVTIQCITDQNTSLSLAGSELFQASGQVGYNPISWQYPGGSGASISSSAINASLDSAGGTLINNGDFENWTANVPDSWEILVGTAGTTIRQGATPYTGTSNLTFIGDGSQLTSLTQTFGTDNTNVLDYGTSFAVNCWLRIPTSSSSSSSSSSGPSPNTLQLALLDENDAVINDEQGTPNTVTLTLAEVLSCTSYTPFNAVFRCPQQVPSTIKLAIRLINPLPVGQQVLIDRLAFAPVTTLYAGGPAFCVFSGSTNFYAGINNSTPGDFFTLTTSNSRPVDNNTMLWLMDRLFQLKQKGLIFPTSNSPTISDGLINV